MSEAAPPREVNKWTVAVSIAFGSLMATIDSSIINVALPQIRGELGASLQEITWVSTAYLVAMVVVMPLTGFLGAFFGQKRVYVASLVIFVVGSALCGTARSLETLILWRVLQGLGGGALQPTQQAILRQTFPPKEQGMAMALFTMVIMIGPAIGPMLGGWLTDNYSWPWIFYINLPVGALGIYLTLRNVHEPADVLAANRARAQVQRRHLDLAGILLMVVGIAALQFVLEEGAADDWFDSTTIVAGTFVAAVALIALVIRELSAAAPVIDLRMFRDPTFAAGTVIGGLVFAMLMGGMFLLPVFTQELLHFTATQSGVVLLPRTLAMMVASPIVGRLYGRVPAAVLVGIGLVLTAIGNWEMSQVTLMTSSSDLVRPLIVTGVAFAFLFVPLTTAALSRVPRHDLAGAAGVNGFVRQVGGSIGLSVFATLFTRYSLEAKAGIAAHVTELRPEVVAQLAGAKARLVGLGFDAAHAHALAVQGFGGRAAVQGTVAGFDKLFVLQAVVCLAILPLLVFLRTGAAGSSSAAPVAVHVE